MGIWKNAFKLPGHRETTEEEKKLLRGLAAKINKKSMGLAVSLAFESTRPLHNLGAQGLVFLTPMLGAVFSKAEIEKFVRLLENPASVSFFINLLDTDGADPARKPAREHDHVEKKP